MGGLAYATSATVIYACAIVYHLSTLDDDGPRDGYAYQYLSSQTFHGGRCAPETMHAVSRITEEGEAAVIGVLCGRVVITSETLEESAYVEFLLVWPVRRAFLGKRLFQRDRRIQHGFERVVKYMRHLGLVRLQLVQEGEVA